MERALPYELVWVDNGSNQDERHALHNEFTFEKTLFLGTNYGMAYGFNTLFFRLCSAPYFLTLEEDWEWLGDDQRPRVGQRGRPGREGHNIRYQKCRTMQKKQ